MSKVARLLLPAVAATLAACTPANIAEKPFDVPTATVAPPVPIAVSAAPSSAPITLPVTPPPPPVGQGGCPTGMAALPAGTFTMGERHDAVTVQPFCLDVTEVTVDAYAACARAGPCSADHPGAWTPGGASLWAQSTCNYGVAGRGKHPINCVDWGESATYCHAQGKRLPSEEEWEWAARGQNAGTTYPWGNAQPVLQLCWSGISNHASTCEVGSFPKGDAPGGIHDLAGNVWEWTSSDYDAGSAARVSRGGGWYDDDVSVVRGADRGGSAPYES